MGDWFNPFGSTATTSTNAVCWIVSTCSSGTSSTAYTTYTNQAGNWRSYNNYDDEQERQARIDREHAEAAKKRAEELLLSHLSDEQKETFRKNKWFVVEGGASKKRYRIRNAGHFVANVDVMDGDKVAHRLCAHCDLRDVPAGDQLLAQKLMLESAEDEFLAIANRHAA